MALRGVRSLISRLELIAFATVCNFGQNSEPWVIIVEDRGIALLTLRYRDGGETEERKSSKAI